jgi:hypothetical protein
VIEGQGVIVTAAAQSSSGESAPAYIPPPAVDQPFVQDLPGFPPPQQIGQPNQPNQQQQPGQQPAMIQTPFGPLANPNAQRQPTPLSTPGQQNSLFPQTQPNQPNNQQISPPFPGTQQQPPPNPFGTTSPFGGQTPPAGNPNPLFGGQPQQRTP